DTDGDGIKDWADTDDDGDGILTVDDDANANGDPTDDDFDADGIPDYRDLDDDNDTVPSADEGASTGQDTAADALPTYHDTADAGHTGLTVAEDYDNAAPGTPTGAPGPGIVPDDATDGDATLNYPDTDDDGDGCLTASEDLNSNGDPTDDTNAAGLPAFLDPT